MIENKNQGKARPLFRDFFKTYFLPFPGKSAETFVENKITKYISLFVIVVYGIILFFILDGNHIEIDGPFSFIKYLAIAYAIGSVLEIIHWFYARFDMVEQRDQ